MSRWSSVLAVWFLSLVGSPVTGYPDGRVTAACDSMTPRHGHHPQPGALHKISVDRSVYSPGDRIRVTLSGPRFSGFLLQARDADHLEGDAVGSFSLIDEGISQLLQCGGVKDSAVSQTNKRRKEEASVYWVPPRQGPPRVQFLATVVEKYAVYWVKIPGPVVSQSGPPPLSPPLSPPLFSALQNVAPPPEIPAAPAASSLTEAFSSSGCGSKKLCVRNPSWCDPRGDPHCYFLSFTREGDSVLIEMSGAASGYLSFALSHDQWMGDDDFYLCVIDGQTMTINPAYQRGRSPPKVASADVLRDPAWRMDDGILQCSFRRDVRIADSPERFPLDRSYYIFLTDGPAEDGHIHRHRRQPLITSRMYDVAGSVEDVAGSRSPLLIKFHGALMFVAWMTTVSIGVLVARFFKPVWPASSLCGEKVWFQVHRILMVCTVVLTLVAFVLPFLYRGHWSARAGYHPYLGCAVLVLAILQPIVAICRPPPHSARRPLFNWLHWGGGTAARVVAVVAMFLGMDLQALDLPDPWDTYTMAAFVLWHVGADILLEVHGSCLCRGNEIFREDRVEILNPTATKDPGFTFRRIALTVYICGNVAFLVTFLAAIYQI